MRVLLVLAFASCRSAGEPMRDPRVLAGEIVVDIASVSLGEDCTGPDQLPYCEPTTVQLSIRAGSAGELRIKRIELFDRTGTLVGELAPRSLTRWDQGSYQPWDGRFEKGQLVKASSAVSSPNWDALPTGRWSEYKVRVTIARGDGDQTLEKAAAFPALDEVIT